MNDQADPFFADKRASDLDAKRALFNEANFLLDDKSVFMLAIRSLRIQWFNEWQASKDWETDTRLKAQIAALIAIPAELQRFVNDYKMATKPKPHRGI